MAGWIFFLGGVFVYFVDQYDQFPTESLKLFDVFGGFHKKILANLFLSVNSWAIEDEKLLQEFNSASRITGIVSIVLSSLFIALTIVDFGLRVLKLNTSFEQLNYGFWLLLIVATALWLLQSALKIVRVHKSLQASIEAQSSSTEPN
jgi:hypothetical protein